MKKKTITLVLLILTSGLLAWNIMISFKHAASQAHCATKRNSTLKREKHPQKETIEQALKLSPDNAALHYKLGRVVQRENTQSATTMFSKALALNPIEGNWWKRLGSGYATLGYQNHSKRQRLYDQADMSFAMAIHFRPNDAEVLLRSAKYWIWRSTTSFGRQSKIASLSDEDFMLPLPRTKTDCLQLSRDLFHQSLSLNSRNWKKAISYVAKLYPDPRTILSILPPGNAKLQSRALEWIKKGEEHQTK